MLWVVTMYWVFTCIITINPQNDQVKGCCYLYFTAKGSILEKLNSLTKVTRQTTERPNIQLEFFRFQSLALRPGFLLISTASLVLFFIIIHKKKFLFFALSIDPLVWYSCIYIKKEMAICEKKLWILVVLSSLITKYLSV